MNLSIGHISELIEPTRSHLMRHPVYTQMSNLRHVQIFMEHHVYAVWDFMSLLKSLQCKFGSFRIPWTPSGHPDAVRLLNEIALAEESDQGFHGEFQSHFSMYRESMVAAGANTNGIDRLIEVVDLEPGKIPDLGGTPIPNSAREFVKASRE